MPISCIIVDDDKMATEYLAHLSARSEELHLLSAFNDPAEALEFLKNNFVDLIFLDVEMPGTNGFELINKLSYKPYIILTTANAEYAYLAFEYNVVDFLKKPIQYTRFKEALQKLSHFTRTVPELAIKSADSIYIKQKGMLKNILFTSIYHIQAVEDYVKIFTDKGSYMVLSTFKNFETHLSKEMFIKTHRSYIVNRQKIDDIRDKEEIVKGVTIPISKTYKKDVFRVINLV